MLQRVKEVQESDLRMVGALARNIQRVLAVTQADIDAAAALGKGWVVWKVIEVNDPIDNLRGGTQLVIKQNSITPGQNVRRVLIVQGPGGETVVIGPGPSPLLLPDAIADSLQYVKAFGGTEQRKLPVGYTQVDYIYFLANSYLTTDINPTYDGRYEFDFQTTTLGSSGATTYLGVRPNSSGNGGLRIARISSQVFRIYGFGSYKDSTTTAAANTRYKFVWNNQHAVMTAGGTTVLDLTYTDTDACAYPITINGWNSAGSVTPGAEGIFVYSFKAWNAQGELVADYVPTKDPDGVVGFYDMVSESFKTATAGTIAAGPNATPTPDAPVDIISNNGALKYSANIANVNAQTALIGYYISAQGVMTADTNNWVYQDYIPVSPNTTYTLTMSSPVYYVSISEYSTASDSGFVIRKAGSTGTNTTLTITTGATTNFIRFGTNIDRTEVTLEEVLAINWQLNKGNSMPYTPYSPTGIYTDGTVETINVHGKNLNGGGALDNKGYTSTGGTSTSTTFCGTLWKIKCKEGEKYTVSFGNFPDGISGVFINTWKTDGTWNTRQAISISGAYTYTIPAGIGEVNFTLYKTGGITIASNSWLQVEKGETATDYEPYYDGGTATAEMLLKVGDYQDEQEILSGAVTRKVGVKVLDGTENWQNISGYFNLSKTDLGSNSTVMPSNSHNIICSHFETKDGTFTDGVGIGGSYVNFKYDSITTVLADWKTWIAAQYAAGTPVIVIYPLATTTTESVTGQPMQTAAGDNTAEITQAGMAGLELEVEYIEA